ncbi:hypothetical protein V6N11_027796 [Hibiscus sabdariffa]|uniref:Uncharacterized protein n=2 Tax=Hibiscus sabdariffa TaxID=183260 RepID=A0ABR2B7V8_9ROSI
MKECIGWDIRDGKCTDFWYDHWLGKDDRLAFSCSMSPDPRPLMVADMMNVSGAWDWDRLETILPRERLERITSVQPPLSGSREDMPLWRWEDKRIFTTRSAYAFIVHGTELHDTDIWKKIWKILVP